MSIQSAFVRSELTVNEEINLGPSTTTLVSDTGANTFQRYNGSASTSPSISAKSHFAVTLSSGSGAVNLLALIGTTGQTLATTGLAVKAIKVKNPNPNPIIVAASASNGYTMAFRVEAMGEALMTSPSWPAVASSAAAVTVTGTGSQVSDWLICLG